MGSSYNILEELYPKSHTLFEAVLDGYLPSPALGVADLISTHSCHMATGRDENHMPIPVP